jgi:isoleucyl-tRNA synthetase
MFVAANGGTLLLDEIGELGGGIQAKLLRALETREVMPVGSDKPVPVDVRLVAATNRNLEEEMDLVENLVSMARNLRLEHGVKIRQPLAAMTIMSPDGAVISKLEEVRALLTEELNLKSVVLKKGESDAVTLSIKPQFKVLGKKVGPLMKEVATVLEKMKPGDIQKAESSGTVTVQLESGPVQLVAEDFQVIRQRKEGALVATEGSLTILLDALLTPALVAEGLARDFVNLVQKKRKDLDLAYTDRIRVWVDAPEQLFVALKAHEAYIQNEVLSDSALEKGPGQGFDQEILGDHKMSFKVEIIKG